MATLVDGPVFLSTKLSTRLYRL